MSYEFDENTSNLCILIMNAMKVTIDPLTNQEERLKAYNFFEKIKENPSKCIPCAVELCSSENEPMMRYLGSQLIEHTIKYHWNDLQTEQRVFIMQNAMMSLSKGTHNLISEQTYVKEKVCSIMVEMIKREWPQNWPNLLEELDRISSMGPTQAELVLFIFLRLSEDIATLQTLEVQQRRKDIYQAMTSQMDVIFQFFFGLLEKHYTAYINDQSVEEVCLQHCRVTEAVFMTLSSFIEWVPLPYIYDNSQKLFGALCRLLSDDRIKIRAAECLLQIVLRKSSISPKETGCILVLFDECFLNFILTAAGLAVRGVPTERNHNFVKTLAQVITGLGTQLLSLWNKNEPIITEAQFLIYLNALFEFTKHPSLKVYNFTATIWAQFFKHKFIRNELTFKNYVKIWLPIGLQKVFKRGSILADDLEVTYHQWDFYESDDSDYFASFYHGRTDTLISLKEACAIHPDFMFSTFKDLFVKCFQLQNNSDVSTSNGYCDLKSPFYLQFEGMVAIIEAIPSQLCKVKNYNPPSEETKNILKMCLSYSTSDVNILSLVLSCISGLIQMFKLFPDLTQPLLQNIFLSIKSCHRNAPNTTKEEKFCIKHGCSLFLKLCDLHPQMILPHFDLICSEVDSLTGPPIMLKMLVRNMLHGGQILLANQWNNYEKQKEFLQRLINPYLNNWCHISEVFSSPHQLITFMGLDLPIIKDLDKDPKRENRSLIFNFVYIMTTIGNYSAWPKDIQLAEKGGFLVAKTDNGEPILRNPCGHIVSGIIQKLFLFLRSFAGIFTTEGRQLLSVDYKNISLTTQKEKWNFISLGQCISPIEFNNSSFKPKDIDSDEIENMNSYLTTVHEKAIRVIVYSSMNMGREFYSIPHLADYYIHSVFYQFDLRTKFVIRQLIKFPLSQLFLKCPLDYCNSILMPIIQSLYPTFMEYFTLEWASHMKVVGRINSDEDENTFEEVYNDQMIRLLTRETLMTIKTLLLIKSPSGTSSSSNIESENSLSNGNVDSQDDVMMDQGNTDAKDDKKEKLGDLGSLCIMNSSICESFIAFLLRAMSWPDSLNCFKAAEPLSLILRDISDRGISLSIDVRKHILMGVLEGMRFNGSQPCLDRLIMLAIEICTSSVTIDGFLLKDVLLSLPGVISTDVDDFVKHMLSEKCNKKSLRVQKDLFKKIVKNVVGKDLSDIFKREVQINNLAPIYKNPKKINNPVDQGDFDLTALFS